MVANHSFKARHHVQAADVRRSTIGGRTSIVGFLSPLMVLTGHRAMECTESVSISVFPFILAQPSRFFLCLHSVQAFVVPGELSCWSETLLTAIHL